MKYKLYANDSRHPAVHRKGLIYITIVAFILCGILTLNAQTLTLRSQLNFPGTFHTDVWGYVDPNTGNEYAILGDASSSSGFAVVDVTDPDNPFQVSSVTSVPGFDVKVWDHYVYTVNGGGNGMGGIVDIADPNNPQPVGNFPSSHNIFISDDGYLFLESPGIRIYDLNTTPENPSIVWSGGSEGHDATVIGDRFYDFHGITGTNIYDISTISNPQLLVTIQDPTITYHHSGWPTEDGQFLYICDELAHGSQPDITVWDISNINNPQKVDQFVDPNAIVHNLQIVGNYAYVSYYTAGFRVFDVSQPSQTTLVDEYDTNQSSGESFGGAFGVYALSPSGNIFVNDWDNGLFVFSFGSPTGTNTNSPSHHQPQKFLLSQNYPNPFNPSTTIAYQIPSESHVTLTIYNALGQPIRTLVNEQKSVGGYTINWDGKDNRGRPLGTGFYFYQIKAGEFTDSKKMLKVE
ncbi:MAG: choice-of-anchor B family protein [Aliifodinibius sp.]|nr:choice-of-anchor B family protein [candidate division Zixibacteria bacterium]NIT55928.1 choice-of-anchor B family protein [Fodinibius sp.]NIV08101.1 choice-of-anchor B family protein [candidate division Zixibacteria bacterium]NIY24512.1 choice-of-anchor B family protein [Fodinibius sp.]